MQKEGQSLEQIVTSLSEHIRTLEESGLKQSAAILGIARLDLQTRLHGISDDELKAFCAALENRGRASQTAQIYAFPLRAGS